MGEARFGLLLAIETELLNTALSPAVSGTPATPPESVPEIDQLPAVSQALLVAPVQVYTAISERSSSSSNVKDFLAADCRCRRKRDFSAGEDFVDRREEKNEKDDIETFP